MNTLTLTGSFSIAEAHSWLALCLAEVPERCPQAETVTFNFRSTFNGGTQLQANYSKGRVSYRSDNLSTIVILRDVISRIVSMGQIKVHIACDINEESIKKCLELIWPKLEYQSRLVRQLELARGLKELEATLEDLSYLNSELKQLLANYEDLHKEVDNQQIHLDRILGIITDLYIDKFKMLGQNVKHKTRELLDILKGECDLEKIVEFFNGK
uniref:Uncharacterized protein n=1 Tax=Meloidogyne enterolobii TaxID=390850 RepID=A0A6V7TVP8_MELEN|nr:unnamed protein product [Meloidogyne enterolobii]